MRPTFQVTTALAISELSIFLLILTKHIPFLDRVASDHPGLPVDHVGVHGPVEPVPAEDFLWSLAAGYIKFTEAHSALLVAGVGETVLAMFPLV